MYNPNSWLIENARLIDPSTGMDRLGRLLIVNGRFAGVDVSDGDVPKDAERWDVGGCVVAPGLCDLSTEFGEPGREEDETIVTGTRAALAGGFTSIALSSNTEPPIDTAASVEFIHQKGARADNCRVYALGCVSKHEQGESSRNRFTRGGRRGRAARWTKADRKYSASSSSARILHHVR